jgi:hypothetical protein
VIKVCEDGMGRECIMYERNKNCLHNLGLKNLRGQLEWPGVDVRIIIFDLKERGWPLAYCIYWVVNGNRKQDFVTVAMILFV